MKHWLFLPLFLLLVGFNISKGSTYKLFHIGRSRDANIIRYDINLNDNGSINRQHPVKIYWVRYTNDKQIEGLSYVQNKLAYGLKFLSIKKDEVRFQFVSYDERTFIIKKNDEGRYGAFTEYKAQEVEVEDIFVQIDGGTFMLPKISFVKLHWRDYPSSKEGHEFIYP